eukprot:CAMPEP_0175452158 /NCGR_PEP_ID=MMETSP0095-20121207/63268_1 /TAXON_ID=311494 /ORGANISM="Alexandrium monilatum, Strain CCMP3105" /LENGTH=81 /DNA_ID=CAMNT_0016752707 /DNA_START=11 /DNA_END=252 /DNA_ORIENTATION=-
MARAQRAHRVACVRLKVKLCPARLRQSPLAWHRQRPGPAMEERWLRTQASRAALALGQTTRPLTQRTGVADARPALGSEQT